MNLEENDDKITKEDERMAMMIKPNEATIIKKSMLPSFVSELRASKTSKEYWNECAASKNAFSSSDIEKMKKMCSGEKK